MNPDGGQSDQEAFGSTRCSRAERAEFYFDPLCQLAPAINGWGLFHRPARQATTGCAYRALKPGGLFTSTEYSVGPGGGIIFPVPWAYDASINFLDPEDVMRERYHTAGFRILEWINYSNPVIEHYERMLSAPPKLTSPLIFGDDAPERQRNSQRNLVERRT